MYLMYVDESGDTGVSPGSSDFFILTGLVIHELRWHDILNSCIDFRRSMKAATGFKLREEIHAQIMVNGRINDFHGIERNQRFMILRNTIDWVASQDSIGIITVIVQKECFTDPKTVFLRGWSTLLQRFENTMNAHNFPGPGNPDERGLIIADNTSGEDLRNLQRKMRRYNPVPNIREKSITFGSIRACLGKKIGALSRPGGTLLVSRANFQVDYNNKVEVLNCQMEKGLGKLYEHT